MLLYIHNCVYIHVHMCTCVYIEYTIIYTYHIYNIYINTDIEWNTYWIYSYLYIQYNFMYYSIFIYSIYRERADKR